MSYEEVKKYAETRRKLREALSVESDEDYSVILWQPVEQPPEDASYVLVKMLEPDGRTVVCIDAAYEKKQFLELFGEEKVRVMDKRMIFGWSYYPFDDRALGY